MRPVSTLNSRAIQLLERINYRIVRSEDEKTKIYELRYRCYLAEGIIEPNADQQLSDIFDEMPHTIIVAVRLDERIIASIRLHILSIAHSESPTCGAFHEIIFPRLEAGHVVIDPTRFVVDRECSREHPELVYLILRMPFIAARYFNARDVIAAVRSEHAAFYSKVLRCKMESEPRRYHQLNKPLCLMSVNYIEEHKNVLDRYPLFSSRQSDIAVFDRSFGK